MSAASTPTTGQPAPKFPPYMHELIYRAAELLQAHFPAAAPVPFNWWANGEEAGYLARLEWPRAGTDGPCVAVFYGRTGQLVCKSLPGQPFVIDPSSVDIDYAGTDEIARLVHDEGGPTLRSAKTRW